MIIKVPVLASSGPVYPRFLSKLWTTLSMEQSQSDETHPSVISCSHFYVSCFRIVDFDIPSLFLNGNVSAPSMFSNLKSISLVRNIIKILQSYLRQIII